MKILIVSGFLGAGKTTFIQSLASHTGKALAIFENEYGISGIDGDRLRNQQNAGTVKREVANALALAEYEKYDEHRRLMEADAVDELTVSVKSLKH